MRIPLDEDAILLDKDWLSPEELEERSRRNIRKTQLRQPITPDPTHITDIVPAPPRFTSSDTPSTTTITPISPVTSNEMDKQVSFESIQSPVHNPN